MVIYEAIMSTDEATRFAVDFMFTEIPLVGSLKIAPVKMAPTRQIKVTVKVEPVGEFLMDDALTNGLLALWGYGTMFKKLQEH